ncbi:hypothetical protein [Maridesulfovibrio sp.]|uniref:hypothetical protein n=1 Tax=Maridesulfovibrio sp. TaxID=2795000 RepID=UPI0029F5A488|nr:hypothetical protein [Maridesulfovibrio sp.]
MIFLLGFCAVVMLCALIINKMITNWHKGAMKAFKQEEAALRNRHERAVRDQKKAVAKLHRLRNRIKTYEQMVEDAHLPDNRQVAAEDPVKIKY